jgi:hypothetical protein
LSLGIRGFVVERPNILSGLVAKRDELLRYQHQLEADIRAIAVDVDHLEAAGRACVGADWG